MRLKISHSLETIQSPPGSGVAVQPYLIYKVPVYILAAITCRYWEDEIKVSCHEHGAMLSITRRHKTIPSGKIDMHILDPGRRNLSIAASTTGILVCVHLGILRQSQDPM
jgi:hypothetical protein